MLPLALIFARQRTRTPIGAVRVLPIFVSMMALGYLLYHLLPAAGPVYAFPALFPNTPPDRWQPLLAPLSLPKEVVRNAMPSLHMATALLICWHSRDCSPVARFLGAAFLLATAFSTMALGEHYFIDLVVAFPFMTAVQSTWATPLPLACRHRWLPLLCGTAMTLGWLALLRFGLPLMFFSPVIPWSLILFTIPCSLLLEMRLSRHLRRLAAAPTATPRA
jgi:PAP2 superfamily